MDEIDGLEWIRAGLEKPGKTRIGLAKALGRAPSMVTALLSGNRQLKANEIATIARYLEVQPPEQPAPESPYESADPGLVELEVIGEVAAGVWTEAMADEFDRYTVAVPLDPRFPRESQFLLRVRGTSINRRAAPGSLVRCVELHAAPRPPRDGDWVIARRMRNGSAETTVKRLQIDGDDACLLWPDSFDPAFQAPIAVGEHDGETVEVLAFVLDFINPATRF